MLIPRKSISTDNNQCNASSNHNVVWLNSIFISIKCSLLIIIVLSICYVLILSLLPKIISVFSADSTPSPSFVLNNSSLEFYTHLADANAVILKNKGYDLTLLAEKYSLDILERNDKNSNNNKNSNIKVIVDFTFSNTFSLEIQTLIKASIQSAAQFAFRESLFPKESSFFYLRRDSFQSSNSCQGVDLPGSMFKSAIEGHLIVFIMLDDTIKEHNNSNFQHSNTRQEASQLYLTSSVCQMQQVAQSISIPQVILLRVRVQQLLNDFPFTWRTLMQRLIQYDIVGLLDMMKGQGEQISQGNAWRSKERYENQEQKLPSEKGRISKPRVLGCGEQYTSLVLDSYVVADCEALLPGSRCFDLTQTAGEHANLRIQSKHIQLGGQCFRFSCKKSEISEQPEITVEIGGTTQQPCNAHPKIYWFKKTSQVYSLMCPRESGRLCHGD